MTLIKLYQPAELNSVNIVCLGSQVMPTSMPPPRKLPQRSWAASIPTILTHNALHVLLLPSPTMCLVPGLAGSYLCSPLERFLGSVIMRRHLQRIIQLEPNVSSSALHCWSPDNEGGVGYNPMIKYPV